MTAREQRMAGLAALVAAVFLLSSAWPALTAAYQSRGQQIEALRADIERERRLANEESQWQERRDRIEERRTELQRQVFQERTPPLLSASIQRLVRQHANEAGVSINATRLAESLEAEGWLFVEQTVSFTLQDQNATLDFLQRLHESEPRLRVSRFSMRSNRNQYSGDLTVVGFARTPEQDSVASNE
ncbi:MAG: type II secretion system protein GspM [Pseudohongiellaceae bacterium]